jgi:glutaredoxin 3
MLIEIYSKENCGFCVQAINKAKSSSHDVKVKKLGIDFTREELFEMFPDAKTFPQIKVDGLSIGGWNEFRNLKGI